MKDRMTNFVRSDKGVTVIEYAIIAMLIALGLVSGLAALGGSVLGLYQSVASLFP